jgi:hypothetical protein
VTLNTSDPVDGATFNEVAQLSHFGWGMLAAVLPMALAGSVNWWSYGVWILWIAYATVKEFVLDERYETPNVRGSSLEDFLFEAGGLALGIVLLGISGRF